MGKYDDAMYRYLADNDRFADLFNAVFFDGRTGSLRDMMRFGQGTDGWQELFHDYGMTLFCAGERSDLSRFGTDLRLLLETLQLRQDKDGLIKLWSGEAFSHLNPETAETMAVMTDNVDILKRLEITEEGEYNMCLAVEEMKRDWRAEGKAEGIIETGMECGLSEDAILEKLQSKLEISRQKALEYLGMFENNSEMLI